MGRLFKHQALLNIAKHQCLVSNLIAISNFQPLQVVGRGGETLV